VLDAADRLRDYPQIQFVLVGDGVALPALQQRAQEMGLPNVKFLGRYPASEMAGLYALADVLLVHLKDDPLFQITIPHKIFAYLASAKPILAAVRGDAAAVIEETGAGLVCPPENVAALVETVLTFYKMPESELQAMGVSGLHAVRERFNKKKQVAELAEVLRKVVRYHDGSS
jgi:glycosyltransferase involved in cell wall biosynthesis